MFGCIGAPGLAEFWLVFETARPGVGIMPGVGIIPDPIFWPCIEDVVVPGVGIIPVPMFWPCIEDGVEPGVGIIPLEVMGVELGIIPLPCFRGRHSTSEQKSKETRGHPLRRSVQLPNQITHLC